MVCVTHASLAHLLIMVDTTTWLFPTIALVGILVLSVSTNHSLIKHPVGDLEGLSTPASSSTCLNQGM